MLRLARDGVALVLGAQSLGVNLRRLMLSDCHVDGQGRLWLARAPQAELGADTEVAWAACLDWFGMCLKMSRDKTMVARLRHASEHSKNPNQLLKRLYLL